MKKAIILSVVAICIMSACASETKSTSKTGTESKPQQQARTTKAVSNSLPVKVEMATDQREYKLNDSIQLSMSVSNFSNETVTFLPWGSPLENGFTNDCLVIVYEKDTLPYHGIMVKRMAPTEKDYISLQPNQSFTGSVVVQNGYPIKSSGVYTLQFVGSFSNLPASNQVQFEVH